MNTNISEKKIKKEVKAIVDQATDYGAEKRKERQDPRNRYDKIKKKYDQLLATYNVEQLKAAIAAYEKNGYEVPVNGSMGLLALGYRGLKVWREKKILHNIEVFGQQVKKMQEEHGFG